jgi:hypothetical protein
MSPTLSLPTSLTSRAGSVQPSPRDQAPPRDLDLALGQDLACVADQRSAGITDEQILTRFLSRPIKPTITINPH